MQQRTKWWLTLIEILAGALAAAAPVAAQNPVTKPNAGDEVVRINTELVQTDFTVFDKHGTFVDRISSDQLELLIDNKPRPIAFFERV